MTSTSDGSQPDAKAFLGDKVAQVLRDLQDTRIPTGFDQLSRGEVPDDIKTKVANRQIIV